MRSRVAPLTMQYWGEQASGEVLLDSLAEEPLFPQFDRVTWHRWLSDGSLVLLNGDRLYRVHPSGDSRLLAAVGEPDLPPRLSPDGRWVAVALGRSITFVPTDGGPVRRLPQPGWVHSIGWHPDSTRLAFNASNRICVATTAGDVRVLETEAPTVQAWWGAPVTLANVPQIEWSADGTRLAYRLVYRAESAPRDCADYQYDSRVVALHGEQREMVMTGGYSPEDGLFSWATAGYVVAYTGNFGEPDTWCNLWTPHGRGSVAISGTVLSYRRTAWHPRDGVLAVEEHWFGPEAARQFGPVAPTTQLAFFTIPQASGRSVREDDWPDFEWAPTGRAFVMRRKCAYVAQGRKTAHQVTGNDIGDFAITGSAMSGEFAQMAPLDVTITGVQWTPLRSAVSFERKSAPDRSVLCVAPVTRNRSGATHARRWLAAGKELRRSGNIEEATICFRNAVRCEPDWAEPRVRLAQCYLDLSARETNPACMAWLLDGAEFETQRAAKLTTLSDDSLHLRTVIARRREHASAALSISAGRWWGRSIAPGAPLYADDPETFGRPFGGPGNK
ncbi:MAG: hypothetical protein JSV65_03000 [Armatimonadota bacterium]|nr:MAG: hypothetical protein JSV65_03000 [Armatimonadota bacterium]